MWIVQACGRVQFALNKEIIVNMKSMDSNGGA
jgi:hypothetical protein